MITNQVLNIMSCIYDNGADTPGSIAMKAVAFGTNHDTVFVMFSDEDTFYHQQFKGPMAKMQL